MSTPCCLQHNSSTVCCPSPARHAVLQRAVGSGWCCRGQCAPRARHPQSAGGGGVGGASNLRSENTSPARVALFRCCRLTLCTGPSATSHTTEPAAAYIMQQLSSGLCCRACVQTPCNCAAASSNGVHPPLLRSLPSCPCCCGALEVAPICCKGGLQRGYLLP